MSNDYKYRTFNVGFYDDLGNEDETQFDIAVNSSEVLSDLYDTDITGDGLEYILVEFLGLWEEFRQENYFVNPKIMYVEEVPYEE